MVVILVLLNLIVSYDFFNIAAVVIVGQALACFNSKNPLQPLCLKFDSLIGEKLFCCFDQIYVTAQQGAKNNFANTDDLVPFDRRKVTGTKISTSQEYINSQRGANASGGAAAGNSAVGAPVGGTTLGGSVGTRGQSKLLQAKPSPRRTLEQSMDEDELLDGNDSSEPSQ